MRHSLTSARRALPVLAAALAAASLVGCNSGGGGSSRRGSLVDTTVVTPFPGGAARSASASVVLFDGRVLTTGGVGASGAVADAWVYDPDDGAVEVVASMNVARWGHTATLLGDGRVLVAGGVPGSTGGLSSLELYDPLTNTWRALTATLASTRALHTAVSLPDGQVAFVGGLEQVVGGVGTPVTTIERFDPRDEVVSTATPATGSTVTAGQWFDLGGGRALCLAATSSVWDLAAANPAATATTNQVAEPRGDVAGVALEDGRLLLAGGLSSTSVIHTAVDVFDPTARQFSSAPALDAPRHGAAAVRLVDGRVAVIGGTTHDSNGQATAATTIEVYARNGATNLGSLATPQLDGVSAVALPGGGALVTSSRTDPADPASSRDAALRIPSLAFTPSSDLHVTGVIPAGGLEHADPYGAVRVMFSAPVDVATVGSAITLTGPTGPVAFDVVPAPDGRSCAVMPRQALRGRTRYTLAVSGAVQGAAGGNLSTAVGAPSVAFTTASATVPRAGGGLLIVEQTNDQVLLADDLNGDGDFDDADEVRVLADIPGSTLQEVTSTPRGEVFVGENVTDAVLRLVDLNGDGDCADPGEVAVFVDNTQVGLGTITINTPASLAIDADGSLLLGNNATTGFVDFIVRVRDLNGDGDALDAGEVTMLDATDYTGALYGLAVDPYGVIWHVVSGGSGGGLLRLVDANGNGRTDDAGEHTVLGMGTGLFDVTFTRGFAPITWALSATTNPRGVRYSTGGNPSTFATSPAVGNGATISRMADGSWLHSSIGSDQLFRLRDLNGDGDVDDAGEVTMVFANASGVLANPYFASAGAAPLTPRLHAPVAAGQTTVAGVTAPFATVSVSVNGGTARTAVANAAGGFEVQLAAGLAPGDVVTFWARGIGGTGPVVRRVVP